MTYIRRIFLILLTFIIFGEVYAENGNIPFKKGETLKYIVSYKWGVLNFDIAIATLTVSDDVVDGVECYKIFCDAKTAPAYQSFFNMDDKYTIWIDKNNLLPIKLLNDNLEGDYSSHSEYYYDWDRKKVKTIYHSTTKPQIKVQEYDLKPNSRDAISAFYFLRTLNFAQLLKAKDASLELVFHDKIRHVKYSHTESAVDRVRGHGQLLVHKFKCTLATSDGNALSGGNEFQLWFAEKDKENRIPIFFYSPIRVGSVRARLSTEAELERFYK